jgi:hypothetical protein
MNKQKSPLDRNRFVVRLCLGLVLAGVVLAALIH